MNKFEVSHEHIKVVVEKYDLLPFYSTSYDIMDKDIVYVCGNVV